MKIKVKPLSEVELAALDCVFDAGDGVGKRSADAIRMSRNKLLPKLVDWYDLAHAFGHPVVRFYMDSERAWNFRGIVDEVRKEFDRTQTPEPGAVHNYVISLVAGPAKQGGIASVVECRARVRCAPRADADDGAVYVSTGISFRHPLLTANSSGQVYAGCGDTFEMFGMSGVRLMFPPNVPADHADEAMASMIRIMRKDTWDASELKISHDGVDANAWH